MIFVFLLFFWIMILFAWVSILTGQWLALTFSVAGVFIALRGIWEEVNQYVTGNNRLFK